MDFEKLMKMGEELEKEMEKMMNEHEEAAEAKNTEEEKEPLSLNQAIALIALHTDIDIDDVTEVVNCFIELIENDADKNWSEEDW